MSRRKRNEDSSSDSDDSFTRKSSNKKKKNVNDKKDNFRKDRRYDEEECKKREEDILYSKNAQKQTNDERISSDDRICLPFDKNSRLWIDRNSNLFLNIGFRSGKVEFVDAYHWNNKLQQYQRVILRDPDEYKAKITGKENNHKDEKKISKTDDQSNQETEERFVYEETSQLYYEKKTGLYYDPNSGLYYNYNTYPATCFHHDFASNVYLPVVENDVLTYGSTYKRESSYGDGTLYGEEDEEDLETNEQDPSQYLLVVEYPNANSEIQTMQHIIGEMANGKSSDPYTTVVTIGRHKTNDIALPDLLVSKYHALIIWESVFFKHYFWLIDVGSKHGTYLNGTRISSERTPSEKQALKCGDVITIGNTKATLNPLPMEMQLQRYEEELPEINNDNTRVPVRRYRRSSKQAYLEEKRKLKNKWQLTKEERKHREQLVTTYTDRAAIRRETNPDTGPFKSVADFDMDTHEPGTSLTSHLPETNIGFILLQKLGWKKGDSLGRTQEGIKEPVVPATTSRRQGLGFS